MSIIREMRERQTMTAAPARSGLGGTLLIGCAAFALGALAIVGWKLWPAPKSPPPPSAASHPASSPAAAPPTFSGKRLGEAGFAPLLRTCMKGDDFTGLGDTNNPQAMYHVLRTVGTASRVGALLGAQTGGGVALTEYWGEIANCVYRQNSWNLCDPDNRALAVESASAFIRGAAQVVALTDGRTPNAQFILAGNAKIKQHVLDTLRARVRSGHIIADDFGPMVPAEIKALLAETKPVANGCVKP